MKVELKTWGALGLATALAGAGLAGCSGEAGESGESGESAQVGEAGEGEGGESGESGESGEGGVTIADASSDPVVYNSALAIAEAHVIAAKDAYLAGKTGPAAEMFAHPVAEVLADMAPVFEAQGVEDFTALFSDASASALAEAPAEEVTAKYDAIIVALRAAAEKAPDSDASAATIAGGVAQDQIERAVAMYPEAISNGTYEPYLDGYGYYKAAAVVFEANSDAIRAENADLHEKISAALALLADAYPSAELPETLDANQGQLSGAASSVALAAG